jgi:hypothetical protein
VFAFLLTPRETILRVLLYGKKEGNFKDNDRMVTGEKLTVATVANIERNNA